MNDPSHFDEYGGMRQQLTVNDVVNLALDDISLLVVTQSAKMMKEGLTPISTKRGTRRFLHQAPSYPKNWYQSLVKGQLCVKLYPGGRSQLSILILSYVVQEFQPEVDPWNRLP